jgi:hypothetical protein
MPLLNGRTGLSKDAPYGYRKDGTPKGKGFLGLLKRKKGGVSSEISIGVDFGDGEVEIPTMVPTLDKNELNYLLNDWDEKKPIPESIKQKAIQHAIQRMKQGLSPFYD